MMSQMNPVRAGFFDMPHLFGEAGEVSGEDGGSDEDGVQTSHGVYDLYDLCDLFIPAFP